MGLFDRKANGDKSKGGTRKCPCCGVRIEADCLFCTACGADLRTSGEALLQEGEGGGMTICPRCGERIEEGCLFCTSCGTDLRKLKKATPVNTVDVPAPKHSKPEAPAHHEGFSRPTDLD